jgi:hypothetical protein
VTNINGPITMGTGNKGSDEPQETQPRTESLFPSRLLSPSTINDAISPSEFEVHEFIRQENHCCVYKVIRHASHDKDPGPDPHFETRVYDLDEKIAVKIRNHRSRCIKRLASRTVDIFCFNGVQLVIYRTGGGHNAKSLESTAEPARSRRRDTQPANNDELPAY